RASDASIRADSPQGGTLEGTVRRFRHRGGHAHRDQDGQNDPPARVRETRGPVSSHRVVTLIRGDGIGPEVSDAVLAILHASGAPLSFDEVVVGREAEKTEGDPLP